jgi:hypothetical protein
MSPFDEMRNTSNEESGSFSGCGDLAPPPVGNGRSSALWVLCGLEPVTSVSRSAVLKTVTAYLGPDAEIRIRVATGCVQFGFVVAHKQCPRIARIDVARP